MKTNKPFFSLSTSSFLQSIFPSFSILHNVSQLLIPLFRIAWLFPFFLKRSCLYDPFVRLHAPDFIEYATVAWPNCVRLPENRFAIHRFFVFVFVRLWLCLFRQVLQLGCLCVSEYGKGICAMNPFLFLIQRKLRIPAKGLSFDPNTYSIHIRGMVSDWMNEQASAYACMCRLFICLYSLVRFSLSLHFGLEPICPCTNVRNPYSLESTSGIY